MNKQSGKVAVIVLNWEQPDDTEECLASLAKLTYPDSQIYLVDNGSRDGSAERLAARFPAVTLIRNKVNLGFAAGNNIAIRRALQEEADYLLLLNNDTTIESDLLDKLVAGIGEREGIISPKILFYQDRKKVWFCGGGFYPLIFKPYHRYYGQPDRRQVISHRAVDWVSGCSLFAKRAVFEQVGLLDEAYFFNYEDVDLCLRARKAGFQIGLLPEVIIYHKFAASAGGKYSPFYTYFRTRNLLRFLKHHRHWGAFALNLILFPLISSVVALKVGRPDSITAIGRAVWDACLGISGVGAAKEFTR